MNITNSCRKLTCLLVKHSGEPGLHSFGLPLPKGYAYKANALILALNDKPLRFELQSTATWPDGSIKWLKCKAIISESGEISCIRDDTILLKSDVSTRTKISSQSKHILVVDGLHLHVAARAKDESASFVVNCESMTKVENAISIEYQSKASCSFGAKQFRIYCEAILTKDSSLFDIRLRVHNQCAAKHEGDTWDLGDANSVFFKHFTLQFSYQHHEQSILLSEQKRENKSSILNKEGAFFLHQYSSGGENWKSPVHWDEKKQSTVEKHGFQLLDSKKQVCIEGLRAEPVVTLGGKHTNLHILPENFWQNFPLSICSTKKGCDFVLFPSPTELQGGESKTWRFKCMYSAKLTPLKRIKEWKNSFCLTKYYPEYINDCKVLPYLLFSPQPTLLTQIIQQSIEGDDSFFAKREKIDEYGWRNFGDLYADHEVPKTCDEEYFVSHYNNQYDPLFGLSVQYLHSGEPKFLDLIHPLSQHIQDIDIYDTDSDKAEYNGGLMWHTDHYLSAQTCTHRSNSKYHKQAYEGFLGGGGPGGQHCYTTGLLFQYRFFADEQAKLKVIQLCNWIRCFYNGSQSVLDRTFRLLTIDLKKSGYTNIGKKAPGFKYPLDRGTGNYLVALLDSFDVSQDDKLLDEATFVIQNTVHPNEDLSVRDLDNIEEHWFYTVFLQALVRFLFVKESIDQIDDSYWYARHTLIHFGTWIYENETFYLESTEQLEFPNDTWCAQDIRKGNLLYFCYYFSDDPDTGYLEKADSYYKYVAEHLAKSNEKHYTRILALLMQNDGIYQRFSRWKENNKDNSYLLVSNSLYQHKIWGDPPIFSRAKIIKRYIKDCIKLASSISIKNECKWLKIRLGRL